MSRPEILFSLFAPVTALAGVGPRIGKLIEKLAGAHVVDQPARQVPQQVRDVLSGQFVDRCRNARSHAGQFGNRSEKRVQNFGSRAHYSVR